MQKPHLGSRGQSEARSGPRLRCTPLNDSVMQKAILVKNSPKRPMVGMTSGFSTKKACLVAASANYCMVMYILPLIASWHVLRTRVTLATPTFSSSHPEGRSRIFSSTLEMSTLVADLRHDMIVKASLVVERQLTAEQSMRADVDISYHQ